MGPGKIKNKNKYAVRENRRGRFRLDTTTTPSTTTTTKLYTNIPEKKKKNNTSEHMLHTLVPTHSIYRGRVTRNTHHQHRGDEKKRVCVVHTSYSGTFIISLSLQLVESVTGQQEDFEGKKSRTGVSIRCDVLERGTHHQTIVHTKVHTSWTKRISIFRGQKRKRNKNVGVLGRNPFFSFSVVSKDET
jgi:hypothetical protein